ncbi:hypothetical protein CAPTEDRAFT_192214 [Capitella teleta]|uniref:Uncharacterized protein n=1 Tax=Capitella teleta TaxID=283909 RepID=R7TQE7_CAPTE|nr:hypothetical protein CAPTEDRAFT_192214 [Capitella teleta]|eukprot:ELT95782.1 hypothetical protein CAPTEDRAFT_192214 [Capitella teleta]
MSGSEAEILSARLDEVVSGGIDNNNFSIEDEVEAPAKDNETGHEEICMDPRGPNIENVDEAEVVFRRTNFLHRQKWRIIKNVAFLCLGCLLNFTAVLNVGDFIVKPTHDFNLLRHLVLFGSAAIGCLFLVQPIIVLVTTKWAVTASFIGHLLYVIAHFYPTEEIILASVAILGVSFSLCLCAVCAYIAKAADVYCVLTNAAMHTTMCQFYGVFFLVCQSTYIWSHLISGFILQTIKKPPVANHSNPLPSCGVSACPSNGSHDNFFVLDDDINMIKVYTMYGISILLSILATLTVAICVGRLPTVAMLSSISTGNNRHSNKQRGFRAKLFFLAVIKTISLWLNGRMFFSIPLIFHLGLQIGFFHCALMKHYASCSVGVWRMPFIYMSYGGISALSAVACSGPAKCINRTTSLVSGFLGNVLSSNEEPAFANFALWLTIGVSAAYFGGNFICVYIQLYVLMAALCLGLAGYFTAEIIDKKIKLTDI